MEYIMQLQLEQTIGTIGKTKFVIDNNNSDNLPCASYNIMMII